MDQKRPENSKQDNGGKQMNQGGAPAAGGQQNEGEGNRTAAREYNRDTTAFANSGQVEGKAREAEKAIDGAEGDALRRAEAKGKSHSHGEDPELNAPASKKK